MEEVPRPEYFLSQVEKDGVDEILRKLSSPSEDEPTKQYAASTLAFQSFYPWCDSKSSKANKLISQIRQNKFQKYQFDNVNNIFGYYLVIMYY
jgi:hypothetical protein